MQILYRAVQNLGAKHSKNFAKVIDRQEEPELYKRIWETIDKNLNVLCGSESSRINPEAEFMQDMMFQGLGIGGVDTLIDVIKYGKYALTAARYKFAPYIMEYRKAIISNLPPLHPVKRFVKEDFRKDEITQKEVNSKIRQIFIG